MIGEADAVVVGANVAGASTARELSTRGVRVLLVEALERERVGHRSCGDGIERYQFAKLGLEPPEGGFVLRDVEVAYLTSPDRKHWLRGEGAGVAIERYGFNQHLLSEAMDEGAELLDGTQALGPVVEGGRVVGVRCRSAEGPALLRAAVTVDATGWSGRLRRQLPSEWPAAERVPREEMAIAYREERRRPRPKEPLEVFATLDFEVAPRGLYWVADRSPDLVNVGIAMQWDRRLPSLRRAIREHVLKLSEDLMETEVIRASGGVIPNRRPLDCPVAPGLLAVGDAACQVQPLSGSGIGASMHASRLAAEAISRALESTGEPGMEELFPYAVAYNRGYGVDQAANHVLRASLQRLTNAQLDRLMGAGIVSEAELLAAVRTGRLEMGFKSKVKAASKLVDEPGLLRALSRLQSNMERARRLYGDYPEGPGGLSRWSRAAARLFDPL